MFDAILLIAGKGQRSGLSYNKVLYKIDGKPMFKIPLETFLNCSECAKVIVVTTKDDYEQVFDEVKDLDLSRIVFTFGGEFRQDSVANGIDKCTSAIVLIHDGARPLIEKKHILEVYESAKINNSSVLAVKTVDTIKELQDGKLITLNRDNLYNIQTPQGVNVELYKKALKKAKEEQFISTDDVSLLEKYLDISPKIVLGSYRNFKVTNYNDLDYLIYLLRGREYGI